MALPNRISSPNFKEFELSQSQKLIFTGQQLQPNEPLYNMVMGFRIFDELSPEYFQQAFSTLVQLCDAFRTVFPELKTSSQSLQKQRVLAQFDYQLEFLDFSGKTNPEAALHAWIKQRKQINFDITHCLFDSALIKLEAQQYFWYFNQHHLLTDAWSTSVIFKNLSDFYQLAKSARLAEAKPLPEFNHYLLLEKNKQTSKAFARAKTYWTEQLNTPYVTSTFYRPVPQTKSALTRRVPCELGIQRSKRLRDLAVSERFAAFSIDLSLMQLFSTCLFAYLTRMSGNKDLAIGTPSHSRTSPELKAMAGLLINIFPLKLEVAESDTFLDLYRKVAEANQQLLINAIPGANDFEYNRAFDVVLNYIPSSFGTFDGKPVQSEWVHSGYGDRNHLLRLQVQNFDNNDEFTLYFDLNEEAFVGKESEWVGQHFLLLMDALLDDAEQSVFTTPLVNQAQQQGYQNVITNDENQAPRTTVITAFSHQVSLTPTSNALVCQQSTLNYQQLDQRSNQLACYLLAQPLPPDAIVGLMMERSIEALVAIWGILKAGYAFLPIDSNYPQKRIEFICQDANIQWVITYGLSQTSGLPDNCQPLNLEKDWEKIEASQSLPLPSVTPEQRAYVIYTSGSTGTPKGVEVTHLGLQNYIRWAADYYLEGDVLDFALFSSLSFDLTITSLFVPLVSGGQLVIYPESKQASDITIRNVIEDNKVDVIKLTPAHLALIQVMDFSASRLKKLIVGGDDFKTEVAQTVSKYFAGQIDIYNEYGPTEATVACTVHKYCAETDTLSSVPIGKPITNCNIFLYDPHFNLVPQGVSGEVFISGQGLAKGYLNQTELTQQRFIQNPNNPAQRLYKTGDLARFNSLVQLEYLGRNDQQIKVRGVRIESSEIEAALLTLPQITDSSVLLAKQVTTSEHHEEVEHCVKCGLAANHPSARLNEQKVCRICVIYEEQEAQAQAYYRSLGDLENWIAKIKRESSSKQDSIMLLSGGKDSSYALCKLVDMGLTPIVFTLDNGFISEGAKANIKRLVDRLGLELIIGETDAMNDIFVDSLTRFSNVCNGCFKTIYTLSMKIARERGIKVICTGLSRGQIFETRVAHLFQQGCFDASKIDQHIIDARKTYHRTDDIIATSLDVSIFEDDSIFHEIQYLDFYRYTDVTLDEMYDYLNNIAPWIRPSDTGRSTNCLINDAGIYVHKKERGYHNYALPYSWDVRLGHKERDAALSELDDELDLEKVHNILNQVGYKSAEVKATSMASDRLIAYYVAPAEIQKNTLQKHLAEFLPEDYIPSQFVWMKAFPLTANGKLDRQALPQPSYNLRDLHTDYIAPSNDTETALAALWSQLLGVKEVGVADNFFDLGGDSIVNIQIVAAAKNQGIDITPQQIFDYPTISQLAEVAGTVVSVVAEQKTVTGKVPLLPSQVRFFAEHSSELNHYNQSVVLDYQHSLDTAVLTEALQQLINHHDGLRSQFSQQNSAWQQDILSPNQCSPIVLEVTCQSDIEQIIEHQKTALSEQLDIQQGKLVAVANIITPQGQKSILIIVIHHLVVDGVSWWILLSDLETYCQKLMGDKNAELPAKTCSVQQWGEALHTYAQSGLANQSLTYWQNTITSQTSLAERIHQKPPIDSSALLSTVAEESSVFLSAEETQQLIHQVPAAFSVQVPELLLTALVQSILSCPAFSQSHPSLLIDIEGHGREELLPGYDLLRSVAWFTSIYPVSLQLDNRTSLGAQLKTIKEQLRQVPNHGIEFGVSRYLGTDSEVVKLVETLPKADLLFNYMGQWERTLATDSRFSFVQPIQAAYGQQRLKRYALEINAWVFDGQLQINCCYNPQLLPIAIMDQITAAFQQNLSSLIKHCLSTDEVGLTPTDFPSADLQQHDLEDIFSEFGED